MHPDVFFCGGVPCGLVSFLSPCVLPLVPGYISMLSGVGMEQLRQGQQPRGGLFASALSFVLGFSAVFISFGASASAVGSFLRENRTTLAPIAGALILLFGLHLLGVLIKLKLKTGIILGAICVALGIVSIDLPRPTFLPAGRRSFFLALSYRIFWSHSGAVAESRRSPAKHIETAGHLERVSAGVCIRFWLDAVHRTDSCHGACARRRERNYFSRRFTARGVFGGPLRFLFCLPRSASASFSSFISASESICTPSNSLAARFCYLSAR